VADEEGTHCLPALTCQSSAASIAWFVQGSSGSSAASPNLGWVSFFLATIRVVAIPGEF